MTEPGGGNRGGEIGGNRHVTAVNRAKKNFNSMIARIWRKNVRRDSAVGLFAEKRIDAVESLGDRLATCGLHGA